MNGTLQSKQYARNLTTKIGSQTLEKGGNTLQAGGQLEKIEKSQQAFKPQREVGRFKAAP